MSKTTKNTKQKVVKPSQKKESGSYVPLGIRVFFKLKSQLEPKRNVVRDGIILLDTYQAKEVTREAVVTSIGEQVEHVKVGDKVLVHFPSAAYIKNGDDEFYYISEEMIVAKFI